ncbi:gliding motility-associated-like protein [Neolewinella xylanilytica]|uniref:Gliding motility-associated-like protein n=1 Tax=Neolewinella xylanilytica TaxID=1514080 RepID=A0A2S6I0U9_9BACT|nr:gliding motility-associated C-terminal domain-containing protein [Neolewinella xylanilytica]PPK84599.1 gliding motility-associated-like protein [Neolewinella xylanilytica]
MFRALLLPSSLLLSCLLSAQAFDPVTVVCTDGPFVLQSPVSDDDPSTYEWEISYDGQQSWQSAGVYTSSITIDRPQSGISYRFRFGRLEPCDTLPDCRRTTDGTLLQVAIPTINQSVTICGRDTLFVGAEALTRTGDYRSVLQTATGCDSIVLTSLTVLPSPDEYYFVDLCPGEPFRGATFTRDTLLTERYQTANGCDSILNFEINVAFTGDDLAIAGDDYLCRGGSVDLTVNQSMAAYAWSDGSDAAGISVSKAGTYEVTVTNFQGCSKTLSHDVILTEVDIVTVDPAATVCHGTATGSIGVIASGDGPLRYGISGTDSLQQDGLFDALTAGEYDVYVENVNGCVATASTTIEDAEALHLLEPGKRTAQLERGDSVLLPLNPNFAYDSLYFSEAAGLGCTSCPKVYLDPPFTEEYEMEATSPEGCTVRESFKVIVFETERSYAPSAFSPNGDGKNDVWQLVAGKRVESVENLRVYDRWGQLHMLREGKLPYYDEQLSWDGTSFGKKVDTGTYIYVATLHLKQGRTEQISGVITLIR